MNGESVEFSFHLPRPYIVECTTGDGCEDVDPVWRVSQLDDRIFRYEVGGGKRGESELVNRRFNAARIFRRGTYKKVDVTSEAGITMPRQGVRADDHVFNFVRV